MTIDALVLSGRGRYADPWHDFAATSQAIAGLLGDLGLEAEVRGTDSEPVAVPRLLVVDAGGGSTPTEDAPGEHERAWREAVLAHVRSGGATLVTHAGCNTLYEDGAWAAAIGGRWVPGASMHPARSEAVLDVVGGDHPITTGLDRLHVDDERYSFLEVAPTSTPLLAHEHDGAPHVCAWVVGGAQPGSARVVVNTLGHDARTYTGADRIDLLRREVAWLLA